MTTLQQALEMTSWRMAMFIGRQRGLTLSSKIRKAELINRLAWELGQVDNLNAVLPHLTGAEQQALAGLIAAGGRVALPHLRPRHGCLRPPRQIPGHYNPPAGPTPSADFSLSPLERLRALGLIFHDRSTNEVFIPVDLIPHLPPPEGLSPPVPVSTPGSFAPVDLLCHDLAYLLALLQRDDISPLHGRWLPPRFLAEWGRCCAVPPLQPNARSELQTGRRRFLHYLAENAGWLPASPPFLKPAPAAWLWLRADRPTRLKTLWPAWLTPDPARWRIFRLPGHEWLTDPATLLSPLHQALTKIDPADPVAFVQTLLAQQPGLVDLVPPTTLNPAEVLAETIIELLRGPFVWLGVLQNLPHPFGFAQGGPDPLPKGEGTGLLPSPAGRGAGGEGYLQTIEIDQPKTLLSSPEPLRLTPQGYAWLTGQPLPDDAPVPAKFAIEANLQPDSFESTLRLTLSGGLPEPLDLAVAVEVSQTSEVLETLRAEPQGEASEVFTLTAPSFIRALHRGWSAPALLDALNHLAERPFGFAQGRPLSAAETALLCAWANAAEKMTLRHAVILETADPAIITRLASTRRGRALIHRTLSPRAVIVDPARLDQLARRLTAQEGVPPLITPPPTSPLTRGRL